MHRMFRTFDILDLVLTLCERKTLARMVRVCHEFHGPAISHLWKHLDGLDKLMGTFSDTVWLFEVLNNGGEYLKCTAQHALVGCDWGSFMDYAQYVRTLTVNTLTEDLEIVRFATLSKPMCPILPKLVKLSLTIAYGSAVSLESCTLLLSNTLTTLNLKVYILQHGPQAQKDLDAFFVRLADCTDLTILAVEAALDPEITARGLAACIRTLHKLVVVNIVPTAHDRSLAALDVILQPVSQLRLLEELALPFETSEHRSLPEPHLPFPVPCFTALKHVKVHSTGSFLRLFWNPGKFPLVSLIFEPDTPNGAQEMAASLKMLGLCCSSTLQALAISAGRTLAIGSASLELVKAWALTDECLAGLLSFKHLVNINVNHHVHMAITDGFLADLAGALPHLTVLSLQSLHTHDRIYGSPRGGDVQGRPLVTKRGLASLAFRCPDLNTLGIRYDASENRELPVRLHSPSSLKTLDVGMSWLSFRGVGDTAITALWINELFPVIEKVSSSRYNLEAISWEYVDKVLPTLRKGSNRGQKRI